MTTWFKASVYLLAVASLITVLGTVFLPSTGITATPPVSIYTLGPFEAVGEGSYSVAHTAAHGDMWDQIYGPGGIASQLPFGDEIAFVHSFAEEFDSPTYTITFTVTVDTGSPPSESGPG